MEKSKKESKTHMKYPAPYSQSWAGLQHPKRSHADRTATRINTKSVFIANELPEGAKSPRRRVEPQRTYIGQDPTVPHLKYGIFKKLNVSRGPSRMLTVKPSVRMSTQETNVPYRPPCIVESKRFRDELPAIAKASTVQKFLKNSQKPEGEYNLGPVFVFRPLEPRSLRALTISPSTHLDIKPGVQRFHSLQMSRYKRSNIDSTNMVHRYMNPDSNSNISYRKSSIINHGDPKSNLRYRRSSIINNARSNTSYNRHLTNMNDAILDPSLMKRLNINSQSNNNNLKRVLINKNNNDVMMESNVLTQPHINNLELNLDDYKTTIQNNYRQNDNNAQSINYE